MEIKKKSFLVYGEDLKEILDELTDEQVAKLFRGMVSYHLDGTDPGFEGVLKYVFIPIRQQMDRDTERYEDRCERNRENGRLGGRPSKPNGFEKTERFLENRTQPKKPDIDIEKDIDTEIDTDTESAQADVWLLSRSVIGFLNEQAGTAYKVDDAENVRLISDLAHKGYTEDQMKDVVAKKVDSWLGDPKVEQYLRPKTLFRPSNFETYLNEPDSARKKKLDKERKQEQARDQYKDEMIAIRKRLEEVNGQIAVTESVPERIGLKEKRDVLQARLDDLTRAIGGVPC